MVDTVCIEIFRHLAETVFPPSEAVACHLFPVVGREAPVLSEHGEIIRWRACLTVHVEQTRVSPCVDAETAYADRYVPFEHDSMVMCVIAGCAQLTVEMEEIVFDACAVTFDEGIDRCLVICGIGTPEVVVGGVVFIA